MSAELLVQRDDVSVYHASWASLLAVLPRREDGTVCDALIVDAPYSERTHAGHDDAQGSAERMRAWVERNPDHRLARQTSAAIAKRGVMKRAISYAAWTTSDVGAFVDAWAPVARGWFATLTDHVLAPAWEAALERSGRYVFAPLACVEPGSRVRISGDGPAQWSVWLIVARPRTREAQLWGALPGGYVVPPGFNERKSTVDGYEGRVVGGKPLWLMERLVEDYTRPGDLAIDPCCGAGTTLLAALRTGRRAIGGDAMRGHAEIAAERCGRRMVQRPLLVEGA